MTEHSAAPAWRSSDILRAVALAFLVYLALRFLWVARSVIITGTLGVLLGLALSRSVDWLERFGFKRGLAATLIVVIVLGALVGGAMLAAPKVKEQAAQMREKLPAVIDSIDNWLNAHPEVASVVGGELPGAESSGQVGQREPSKQDAANKQDGAAKKSEKTTAGDEKKQPSLSDSLGGELGGLANMLFPFLSNTMAALAGFLLIVFVAIFIASDPDTYRAGMMHLIPRRARPRGAEVLDNIGAVLRSWLVARALAMVAVGLVTWGILALLEVPAAAVLGLLAGLLEFVPFFGPVAAAIPIVGMAVTKSPQTALYAAIAMLVIQQLEGNLITPLLLESRVDVPPALTIIGVAAMGLAFGLLGMLIAEPVLAATLAATKMLYVSDALGDTSVEPEPESS
ncbi:MAG TPA: AI-2E family transporter [Thermoanaerobaculia bacterium]|nr:AI-2E family transporter [Thermoanaerobaculia bacterium]